MKDKNYLIDFLRFIFSIAILLYHSWMFTGVFGEGLARRGYLGVDFYFIVTGYLMLNSLHKEKLVDKYIFKDTLNFVIKKYIRLLPALIVTFIISIPFVYGKNALNYQLLLSNSMIGEILQLGILGYPMPINSSWWYLSAMFLVSLILYPIAKKYTNDYARYIAPVILLFTVGLVYTKGININDPLNISFYLRNGFYKAIIFIILGNISYEISNGIKKTSLNSKKIKLLTIFEILTYLFLILNLHYYVADTLLYAILLTLNIAVTFSNITYTKKFFKNPIWNKLGTFGFYIYLCQIAIRTYMMRHLTNNYINDLIKYIIITVIVSTIIYIIIEIFYKNRNNIKKNGILLLIKKTLYNMLDYIEKKLSSIKSKICIENDQPLNKE